MRKLLIIATHPIQYYTPLFRHLSKKCILQVFYTWGQAGSLSKYDPGFGKEIAWDLPLLEGYDFYFLENTAKEPGSHHGKGITNPDIIKRVHRFKPDAILVYGYIYKSHFKVMRHFKGKIPIWFRGDSTLLDEVKGWKKWVKSIYLKWIYSYVDKAFYVGSNNKAYFKKYGLKENQLIFAPHAIDNERFAADRKTEALALRKSLGIVADDILILFAGKLEPKKNPELLLEAFVSVTRKQAFGFSAHTEEISPPAIVEMTGVRQVHLLFVGNGILESKLKSQISNLKSQIHFMDFQNQTQMPVVYQACDVFCLPSQGPGETWGLAVNEAMAAGKAIIASDKVGCAIDLVEPKHNGYIFESGEFDQIKDILGHISLASLKEMGLNSSTIINNWRIELQADVIIDALND